MDIGQFVEDVLVQLNNALTKASGKTDNEYLVDMSQGVRFDLAVTISSQEDSQKNKKVGILKVVEAGVGQTSATCERSETISRIQFKIYHG